MGNQPPVLTFAQGGAKVTGPPTAVAATLHRHGRPAGARSASGSRIRSDREEPKRGARRGGAGRGHGVVPQVRGPGTVTFDQARIPGRSAGRDGRRATATFSAPGEYLLRVQANDESGEGGGGFQCCWTNTYVKVTVK